MSLRDFFTERPPINDGERDIARAAYCKGLEEAGEMISEHAAESRKALAGLGDDTPFLHATMGAQLAADLHFISSIRAMQTTAGAAGGEGK